MGAFIAVLSVLFLSSTSFAQNYIVKFKTENGFQRAISKRNIETAKVVDKHAPGKLALIEISPGNRQSTAQLLSQLLKNPEVEYLVENTTFKAFNLPNDPELSKQWSVEKVRAAEAWKLETGSRATVVAVIDTGVDLTHPDIKENLWTNKKEVAGNNIDDDQNGLVDDIHGYDFAGNDGEPNDETGTQNPGHGTHCAGIVGAVGDNGIGISGMSQRVSIMALRFLDASGMGDLMNAVKAIDYAIANGAQIISASWGATVPAAQAQPITEAIGRANDKGVLFVAAAANDGKNNDTSSVFPANTPLPNVISVAASTDSDTKPSWSNFGKSRVSLAAPGENIYSTLPPAKYGNLSGTSMATPLVSGLAALMLSKDPNLNPLEVKALLQASGKKVEIETACNCRVDSASVLGRIKERELTVVPQAATLEPSSQLQLAVWGGKGPYKYTVSSDSVASVDEKGLLTAKAEGEVNVTVMDSSSKENQSLTILVKKPGSEETGQECPLGDPALCQIMCGIAPELPWCSTKR